MTAHSDDHGDNIDRSRQFELEAELALEKDKNELRADHPYLKPTTRSKIRHKEDFYTKHLRRSWATWQAMAAEAYKKRRLKVSLESFIGGIDFKLSPEQVSKLRVKIIKEL